jgi:hypothetical protein
MRQNAKIFSKYINWFFRRGPVKKLRKQELRELYGKCLQSNETKTNSSSCAVVNDYSFLHASVDKCGNKTFTVLKAPTFNAALQRAHCTNYFFYHSSLEVWNFGNC